MGNEAVTFTRQDAERLKGVEDGLHNLDEKLDDKFDTMTKAIEQTGEIVKLAVEPLTKQQAMCQSEIFPKVRKNSIWITVFKWAFGSSVFISLMAITLKAFNII